MNKFDQFKKLQFRVLNFIFVEYIHKNNNAYIFIYFSLGVAKTYRFSSL